MLVHPYSALVILQLDLQDIDDLPLQRLGINRKSHFDTTVKVALHPVGRGEVDRFFTTVQEVPHTGMFQVGIHNTRYPDILAVGLVGYQAADAADNQVDLHSCLAGTIEGIDHPLVFQTVHF